MYLLDFAKESEKFRYHNYPVNQLFGIQNGYPSFMEAQHQINSTDDVENYLLRLALVEKKFTQELEGIKLREEKGIIPPVFVIERVLEEMNTFVDKPIEENILYTSLAKKMKDSGNIEDAEQTKLLARAKENINDFVHPAYKLLIDYFTAIKDKATSDDGYWRLPDGEEAYASSLKFFTTTDYTPQYIHDLGLREVDRIQSEIMAILAAQNFDVSQGFTAAIDTLAADESFYYEDSDAGREQILKDYQKILDEF